MLKLSRRSKGSLIIAGTALISIGALIAVLNIDNTASAAEPASSAASSPSTAVSIYVPPIEPQSNPELRKSGTSSAFVPSSGASQAGELTKIEKPVSTPPAPSVASGTNTTDKNKKPSYSSSSPAKNNTTKKASNAPKGKSYMPGFGYVDGTGGGQMTKDNNMYEDGVKVGTMD